MTVGADVGRLYGELAGLAVRPGWHRDAACRGLPPDLFFPGSMAAAASAPARRVCANCPVTAECAAAGRGEPDGIWGGRLMAKKSGRRRRAVA